MMRIKLKMIVHFATILADLIDIFINLDQSRSGKGATGDLTANMAALEDQHQARPKPCL